MTVYYEFVGKKGVTMMLPIAAIGRSKVEYKAINKETNEPESATQYWLFNIYNSNDDDAVEVTKEEYDRFLTTIKEIKEDL